jgi:uncharacterized tellurite resistance protein B-like protein
VAFLLRFLGLSSEGEAAVERDDDSGVVRRIAAQLERLDPAAARYLAAFAYVLARVANADLNISKTETEAMQEILESKASLAPEEAALVVEIAKSQSRLLGGTENYTVTREYRNLSTRQQRAGLLDSLYAVAAADGTVSGDESAEIVKIAEELGFLPEERNAIRARYREFLSEFQS